MRPIESPVDDRLYRLLRDATQSMRGRTDLPSPALREQAEALLFLEARLLDEHRYSQWAALFADDGLYWVPINPDGGDPRHEVSFAFDDRRRLDDRIARLETGWAHSQIPPSRTVRLVTNVEAWADGRDGMEVCSTLLIHEFRRGRSQTFAARQEHGLARHEGELRITRRVVRLIDADQGVGNISFIV